MNWIFIEKAFRVFISPVINTYIAYELGEGELGLLMQVLAIQAFVASLSGLGIENLISTKRISRLEITPFLFLKLLISVSCGIIVSLYYSSSIGVNSYFCFFIIVGVSLLSLTEQLSIGFSIYSKYVMFRLFVFIVFVLFKLFAISAHLPVSIFYYLFSLELIFLGIFSSLYLFHYYLKNEFQSLEFFKRINYQNFTIVIASFFNLLRRNRLVVVPALAFLILFRLDYLLFSSFVSHEQVGIYAWAMVYIAPMTGFGRVIANQMQSNNYLIKNKITFALLILILLIAAALNFYWQTPIAAINLQHFSIPIAVYETFSILLFGVPISLIGSYLTIWNISSYKEILNLIRALVMLIFLVAVFPFLLVFDVEHPLAVIVVTGHLVTVIPNMLLILRRLI